MISFDPFSPQAPSEPPPVTGAVDAVVAPPPPPSRKTALVLGGLLGVAALAGLAFFSGLIPGLSPRKPAADIAAPELAPMPAPVEAPAPEPAPDERQAAIDFAKDWSLKDGKTLGQALETLSPSSGNLSPWMAEPLSSGRVQVNYFARGSAPGSPTVAYEFEADLTARTLSGRNAAAKAVMTGKAAPPPTPKKARPVKVKAKPAAAPAPKPEEDLNSLLGGGEAAPSSAPSPEPEKDIATPTQAPPEDAPKPAKSGHAKRAAKAAPQAAPDEDKAEDASLLDDLLKE